MQNLNTFTLSSPDFLDMRLDKALPLIFQGHSRSFYENLMDKDLVKVNQKTVKMLWEIFDLFEPNWWTAPRTMNKYYPILIFRMFQPFNVQHT
mgnify:CR=1 FL=1